MTISKKNSRWIIAALVAVAAFLYMNSRVEIVNRTPTGTNIIALGDSLTFGSGAGPGEDYPTVLSNLSGVEIINKGIPGDTTKDVLHRLDRDVLQQDPKIVILLIGGNDLLQQLSPDDTIRNVDEIVRQIQAKGAMVVLVGFNGVPLNDSYGPRFKKLARERGCVYVHNILGGIFTNRAMKSDQIHPNAAGYKLMAERIHKAMKPYLR